MQNADDGGWPSGLSLEKARRTLALTSTDLYARYVGVTGLASMAEVDAHLLDIGESLPACEHDKLVLALNECFLEQHLPDRLPFHQP